MSSWTTPKTKEGESWSAWVAGPAVGIDCHPAKPTKCCLKAYLGETAQCPGCDAGYRLDWVAYQPLFRESDNKPVCVVLHRDQLPTLERLSLHRYVSVGREVGANNGMWIRPMLKHVPYTSTLQERIVAQDIYDWLPKLWRYSDRITGDILRGRDAQPAEVKPKAVPTKTPAEWFDESDKKLNRLAKAEAKAKAEGAAQDVKFANLVAKMVEGKNGTNGTH